MTVLTESGTHEPEPIWRERSSSPVLEDITDILGEVTGINMLVGFGGRLWVLVAKCALSRTWSVLAVERIA